MNALLLAAEGGSEGGSGLSIILPAAAELVYGAISFVIVYFVLAKFAFPKLNAMLEERSSAIQGRMEEAERTRREADEVKSQYQAQLGDAKGEANRIIEEAKQTAESLRRDIVAKAEAEAQAIVSRAQNEVANERDRALQELRSEVGALSVQLASKIVEKELDPAAHQHLVDEYIQKLSRTN
ncbi:MAG: F0F1 ATP synthase subunit B [Actinobacteria bacterium]|nr:F0F1 ATP synthase subunit B [Actinomycetota bacterium]